MSSRKKFVEERLYYSPPALRRYNQQQQQQQQQQQEPPQQQQLDVKSSSSSLPGVGNLESDSDERTNLDRFLEHTIPFVPAQHFSRTTMRSWRNRDRDFHPYFILGDLWESFREMSAYGAAVPLMLNGKDSVIQYYVPSLSGIQLYMDPSRRPVEQRRPGSESDGNSSRATSSDGGSESGTERVVNNTQRTWNKQNKSGYSQKGSTSVNGDDISNPPGQLIFEYFERELPYHRQPLSNKISVLASRFSELKTYKSCDLTPSSWISVAWYPIYRIPVGSTLQNIDASFLTFHSLAKPITCGEGGNDAGGKLSLPTFGLVSYKFKISDWNANGAYESQKVDSLSRAADNWLRLLQVNHPDYTFFTSHNSNWREKLRIS